MDVIDGDAVLMTILLPVEILVAGKVVFKLFKAVSCAVELTTTLVAC